MAPKPPRPPRKAPPTTAEPGRLAKWLANPGLRSKLPDNLLTPEQLRARKINADPYHKAIQSLAQQKYGQPIAQVQQAQRTQDQHTTNVGNWFGQYQAELARSRDRQKATQDAATQSVADRTASFASMNNQGNQQDMAALQADAATRGATVGGTVAKVAGDANTIREALGKQSANTLATQGVSNNAAAEGALVAAYGEAALAKQREQDKRSTLDTELRNIVKDRAAYKVDARRALEEDAYKRELEAKAFGLDIAKFNADQAPKPAKPLTEAEKLARARRKFLDENGYLPPTGKPKPAKAPKKPKPTKGLGSLTKAQEAGIVKDINTVTDAIRKGAKRADVLVAGGGRTPAERRAITNAANDLAKLGYLSPANIKALRALGVHAAQFPRTPRQGISMGTDPLEAVKKTGQAVETIGRIISGKAK